MRCCFPAVLSVVAAVGAGVVLSGGWGIVRSSRSWVPKKGRCGLSTQRLPERRFGLWKVDGLSARRQHRLALAQPLQGAGFDQFTVGSAVSGHEGTMGQWIQAHWPMPQRTGLSANADTHPQPPPHGAGADQDSSQTIAGAVRPPLSDLAPRGTATAAPSLTHGPAARAHRLRRRSGCNRTVASCAPA